MALVESWSVWYSCALAVASVVSYIVFAGTSPRGLPLKAHCQSICTSASALFRNMAVRIMRQGPIPQHIAFIMDGNRRFARKIHLAASSGHVAGFSKLTDVLRWCNDLGVRHVSVYAFAINNFNRSPEEVSTLMSLARNKLRELADKSDLVQKHGLRIRVVGYRELLSADVRESIEHAEETTKDNKGMTLNVCFPYSATDEISSAIRTVVEDVGSGKLQAAEADEKALEERLQIPGPDLDILIRTSGQIRFSNFMLWQSSKMAYIQFVDAYWPEFSLRHMLYILVSWQLSSKRIESRKRKSAKRQIDSKAAASTESATASDNDTCCS